MAVFVGTPPFRRIALWVAMETMHLYIATIIYFTRDKVLGHDWGSNERLNTHRNLSYGSKSGHIRSYGISNMILIACFQRFFFIFFTIQKYHFTWLGSPMLNLMENKLKLKATQHSVQQTNHLGTTSSKHQRLTKSHLQNLRLKLPMYHTNILCDTQHY